MRLEFQVKDREQSIGALSLRRDDSLAASSFNIHYIYLNIQLRALYIDISIVEIYAGSDM